MITYIDKGPGLDARITQAGHWAVNVNGVWHASDDGVVQTLIDSYTLDQAKDWVKKQIDAHAAGLRDAKTRGVSPAEMASWALKKIEAADFRRGVAAPMLSAEALSRGVTVNSIVTRVENNATAYMHAESAIAGAAGRHKDAIDALTTFADVLAYNWRNGWPV